MIIAASALAHLWCLASQFYLDDLWQIRDSDLIREGRFLDAGVGGWTYLWYTIEARISGTSPVAFHTVNWLLHTAVAFVLYGSGRDYLRGRGPAGAALLGAVLFAVHPLGSEIPNYARTQDIAWVTLFSLLAAWCLFRFLRDSDWKGLAASGVFVLGAAFSKGPGLLHAAVMAGTIGIAFAEARHRKLAREKGIFLAVAALVAGLALWKSGWLDAAPRWSEPRFIGHALTVCRVFWEFAWRCVLPISLSADHHIAETLVAGSAGARKISDAAALWAAAGVALFAAISLLVAWRKSTRIIGVCFFLFVGAMLLRLLYFIPEFMPEYRIYPGLPWFCLGAAILMARGWRTFAKTPGRIPALALVLVLAALSARRSFLWHDLADLMADVLRQYPTQARAVWVLQRRDIEAGRWQAVIERHRTLLAEVTRRFHEENRELFPRRELPTGHHALAEIGCTGLYARAVAHQDGPEAGMKEIDRLEGYMRLLRLDPIAHAIHWSHFRHAKGLVLELAGNDVAAAEFLRKDPPLNDRKLDLERVEKKLRMKTGLSRERSSSPGG